MLNIIWLVFGGLFMALGYAVAGVVLAITIVGIPFAIASFRMANFALWPFGRRLVDEPRAGAFSTLGNVLWLLLAGWWLALGHVLTGIAQCVTIIGIPLGIANFKLIPVSLFPLGKRVVDADSPYAFIGR
ncbi:YccF domain-containing protein [Saccharopolyspora taberi]|uniref:YccF domain-containing protein n=1 Tax=Saccharopolyspora taberi TaxID=60895 RepID=A0ABN3VJF5_9PSEU